MILKHFLMDFCGVATVTGVGIGVYYGTNSNAKEEVQALALKNSEEKKPNVENSVNGSIATNTQTDSDTAPQKDTP